MTIAWGGCDMNSGLRQEHSLRLQPTSKLPRRFQYVSLVPTLGSLFLVPTLCVGTASWPLRGLFFLPRVANPREVGGLILPSRRYWSLREGGPPLARQSERPQAVSAHLGLAILTWPPLGSVGRVPGRQ